MSTRRKALWLVVAVVGAPLLYVASYMLLVDRNHPSLNKHGRPTYRSSYPRISSSTRWNRPYSWYFSEAGAANLFFLPIDSHWRSWRGLPSSTIQDEDIFWQEYFEYLVTLGVLREQTNVPNEKAPDTAPMVPDLNR